MYRSYSLRSYFFVEYLILLSYFRFKNMKTYRNKKKAITLNLLCLIAVQYLVNNSSLFYITFKFHL